MGWESFIGIGKKMSFEKAKEFIRNETWKDERISSRKQFVEWTRSGKRPFNFPSNPWSAYKSQWRGLKDFLGAGRQRNVARMSFINAKAFMRKALFRGERIRTREEFRAWSRSGERPTNFPGDPFVAYKDDWVSWRDFLGLD